MAGWGTDHKGTGKCRNHGGCTPSKHGLYSAVIPAEYREKYEDLRQAPNMNSLIDELAYLRIVFMRLKAKHGSKTAEALGNLKWRPWR